MSGRREGPPATVVDAVRARVTPFFPNWEAARIEALVRQMAALEWRYLSGCCIDTRPANANPDRHESPSRRPND